MPFIDGAPELPPAVRFDVRATASGPSGTLLRPGDPLAVPPSTAEEPEWPRGSIPPDRSLGLDAHRLVRLLSLRVGLPQRWFLPGFGREVELVRAHLRPIGSRALLASSFGREAFHRQAAPGSDVALGDSAVRVAYALRWLELGDGVARQAWPTIVR